MEGKEREWHIKRIGKFTASEVGNLMSKSGKWTQTAISYLYKIQRQRTLNQPAKIKYAKSLDWGKMQEPYAVEWLRRQWIGRTILHCDVDFPEKIFIDGMNGFGGSPDAYLMDGENIEAFIEIKSVFGEEETNYIFSPTAPYLRKRERILEEHGWQLCAQLMLPNAPDTIYLLKYDGMDDDDEFDVRDTIDPSRGVVFKFTREELSPRIAQLKERIEFANNYLKSGGDLDEIQKEWEKRSNIEGNGKK